MPVVSAESANVPGSEVRVRNLSSVVPALLAWHHFSSRYGRVPAAVRSLRWRGRWDDRPPRFDRWRTQCVRVLSLKEYGKVFTEERDRVRRCSREVSWEQRSAI